MPSTLTAAPGWFFPLGVFVLGVFFATLLVRRFVESYISILANRPQWKKVWLPALPVFIGATAAGIMYSYPFLSTLPTWGTRAVYGMVGGGLSSFAYKVVTAVIQAKFGVRVSLTDAPEAEKSTPPVEIPHHGDMPKLHVPYPGQTENEGHSLPDSGVPLPDSQKPTDPDMQKP